MSRTSVFPVANVERQSPGSPAMVFVLHTSIYSYTPSLTCAVAREGAWGIFPQFKPNRHWGKSPFQLDTKHSQVKVIWSTAMRSTAWSPEDTTTVMRRAIGKTKEGFRTELLCGYEYQDRLARPYFVLIQSTPSPLLHHYGNLIIAIGHGVATKLDSCSGHVPARGTRGCNVAAIGTSQRNQGSQDEGSAMLARGGGPLWRAKRWVLQVRSAPHQESPSGVALLLFITWTYCNLVRIVGAYSPSPRQNI